MHSSSAAEQSGAGKVAKVAVDARHHSTYVCPKSEWGAAVECPSIPECEKGLGALSDLGQVADVVDVDQQLPEITKQE